MKEMGASFLRSPKWWISFWFLKKDTPSWCVTGFRILAPGTRSRPAMNRLSRLSLSVGATPRLLAFGEWLALIAFGKLRTRAPFDC